MARLNEDSRLTLESCSVLRNGRAGGNRPGAVSLPDSAAYAATVSSISTDWGAGADNNLPYHVSSSLLLSIPLAYDYGDGATFTCEPCGGTPRPE